LLDYILFLTFCTGLFLLSRKKTGGARALPAPPLATALPQPGVGVGVGDLTWYDVDDMIIVTVF